MADPNEAESAVIRARDVWTAEAEAEVIKAAHWYAHCVAFGLNNIPERYGEFAKARSELLEAAAVLSPQMTPC